MAIAQLVELEELPVIGMDLVISRGTKPSVARIRLSHNKPLDLDAPTLQFRAGPQIVKLQRCEPDLVTLRYEDCPDNKREYRLLLRDRRVRWGTMPLEGEYNVRYRDNTVKPSTQKTVDQLCSLALTEAGESSGSLITYLGVYPHADWSAATVASGLDELSAALPIHVCWQKGDTYTVQRTGSGDSITAATLPGKRKIPEFPIRLIRGPKVIKVVCGPTWFQMLLELEAVGLDTDGQWKPINDLSYKPAGGWESEWPEYFTGVAQAHRHLALATVFRCYRVKPASAGVSDLRQIVLDPYKVAMAGTGDNKYLQPAEVFGTYYPWSDHYENTGDCTPYPGNFHIDAELRIVWFETPIFSAGTCVAPATLYLETGFHLREQDGSFQREEFTLSLEDGEGEFVLYRPELWKTDISPGCAGGSSSTNTAAVQEEANIYLYAWGAHFEYLRDIKDVPVAGVWQVSTSGNIAQVSYRVGGGLMPETRASEHYEHR